ncbi:MAG: PQQ-binding-like beta-propeller repeat protein, partial [Phycisphaerae bacterium]|nr:PQQ-binding-like beta-propeller repeat protein [Phycisphaerae bacterium]
MKNRAFLTICAIVLLASCFSVGAGPDDEGKKPVCSDKTGVLGEGSVKGVTYRGGASLGGQVKGTLGDKLQMRWKFKTGAEIRSTAVIADGKVYFGSNDSKVYALALKTRKTLWEYKTGDAVEASGLLLGDTLYIG